MEQFNLDTWLKNKRRKIRTRDGRPVRIVCWDRQSSDDDRCIVGLVDNNVREDTMYFDKSGHYSTYSEGFCDLVFADEEDEESNMNTKETEIYFNEEGTGFTYNGEFYDCEYLITFEKLQILTEAEYSHKDEIENMYDKDSLKPQRVKLYLDDNDKIMYLMVVYEILYKDHLSGRYACGAYQVSRNFFRFEGKTVVAYHNYQDSICW